MHNNSLSDFNHIVAIGGGHGLGRLLSSLSFLGPKLTGIVTTTDNGGSTGRIRKSENCIAWGDLRNCINQLVPEPSVGSMLFEYRFQGNGELAGHNLGNLMLLALDNLCIRPVEAVQLVCNMLKVKSFIYPMAEEPADLLATCHEGQHYHGEVSVDQMDRFPDKLNVSPKVTATREAVTAIEQAELIILGPGSFLTSIMPPLLLKNFQDALRNSNAKVVFVANLEKELGPASMLELDQQLLWCEQQIGFDLFDKVLLPFGTDLHGKYSAFYADLAEPELTHRHDRNKLRNSLEKLVALLPVDEITA